VKGAVWRNVIGVFVRYSRHESIGLHEGGRFCIVYIFTLPYSFV
jgi:hypothetical protein